MQDLRPYALGLGCAATLAAGWWFQHLYGAPSLQGQFLAACDKVIEDRLRSPTTYVRVEATEPETRPATEQEFLGLTEPEDQARRADLLLGNPELADAEQVQREIFAAGSYIWLSSVITYDAANAFGAPIRRRSVCSLVMLDGTEEITEITEQMVEVDGKTSLEWLISQL